MHVLITGGTGFIGSRLAHTCVAQGDQVRVLGLVNTDAEAANLPRLQELDCEIDIGSITDEHQVRRALDGVEVVYHLAAAQHEVERGDKHFFNVNVEGTRLLLTAAEQAGVRRFIHGSTIGVYEAMPGRIVHDDSPLAPNNIYGRTKLEGERVVAAFRGRVPYVIMRISETYGPGDRRLLKLFRALAKGRFFHIGRGENLHHLLYVDDLIAAMRQAVDSDAAVNQTLVVPGHEAITSRQMVEQIAAAMQVQPPQRGVPLGPLWLAAVATEKVLRPLGVMPPLNRRRMQFFVNSYKFSGDAARQLLGYAPKTPVEQGLAQTAQWYRQVGLLA